MSYLSPLHDGALLLYHTMVFFMRNRSLSLEKEYLLVLVGKSYHVSYVFWERIRTFILSIALMNYENGIYQRAGALSGTIFAK